MAIFRFAIESVSRRTGRSAPAAAAYRAGKLIYNERTGRKHDYRRRSGVEDDFLVFPAGCTWTPDRSELWNSAEAREIRKDAKLARDLVCAIPWELNRTQRRLLCSQHGHRLADYLGVAVDVCIHAPGRHGDKRNFHAHFLITTRVVGPAGLEAKTRQLDVSTSASIEVEYLRTMWEESVNGALEQAGSSERVSRLSHARRGDGLMPQITLGVAATAMERRGDPTEIGRRNNEIAALNGDWLAHQADVAGFQAAVKIAERRHGGENAETSGTASTWKRVRPMRKSAHIPQHAASVGRTLPSFSERRAGSERRMTIARVSLGIAKHRSASSSDAIARAVAELKTRDQPDPEALRLRVQAAWASEGPIEMRSDGNNFPGPLIYIISRLNRVGLKVPTQREGTQRIYLVPVQSLVMILARLPPDGREDFLKVLREAGLVSRAERARHASQQLHAERIALAASVRGTFRVGSDVAAVNLFTGPTGPSRSFIDELLRLRMAGVQQIPAGPADLAAGTTRWMISLEPLIGLMAEATPDQDTWLKRLAHAAADSGEAMRMQSAAGVRLALRLLHGTGSTRGPAAHVPPHRARNTAITQAPSSSAFPSEPKTQVLAETPVVAYKPGAKPAEEAARDIGAAVQQQLAAEGDIFTQWAASWSRAASKKDNSHERNVRRAAWEETAGLDKVAQAITMILVWARSNNAEATKWAFSVETLPKTEFIKLRRKRQEVAEKQKSSLDR